MIFTNIFNKLGGYDNGSQAGSCPVGPGSIPGLPMALCQNPHFLGLARLVQTFPGLVVEARFPSTARKELLASTGVGSHVPGATAKTECLRAIARRREYSSY